MTSYEELNEQNHKITELSNVLSVSLKNRSVCDNDSCCCTLYEELNEQNHKITELSNVLSILLKDRSLCDTDTCCTLFYSYMDRVNKHMHNVDSNLYTDLLKHPSSDANIVANNFMSGSQEIKRIIKRYVRKWCGKQCRYISIGKGQHITFIKETDEMFKMILNRVQDEMEHLYPMVRRIQA